MWITRRVSVFSGADECLISAVQIYFRTIMNCKEEKLVDAQIDLAACY